MYRDYFSLVSVSVSAARESLAFVVDRGWRHVSTTATITAALALVSVETASIIWAKIRPWIEVLWMVLGLAVTLVRWGIAVAQEWAESTVMEAQDGIEVESECPETDSLLRIYVGGYETTISPETGEPLRGSYAFDIYHMAVEDSLSLDQQVDAFVDSQCPDKALLDWELVPMAGEF